MPLKWRLDLVRDYFLETSGDTGKEWLQRFEKEISTCEAKIDAEYKVQFN
ncbi:hypothetical protein ACLKMH_10320 [Psychromonas sp. KJ10-10]